MIIKLGKSMAQKYGKIIAQNTIKKLGKSMAQKYDQKIRKING